MAISFDNALGIHEQALYLRSRRADVLANNLANVDTPNFKARDVDFSSLLQDAQGSLAANGRIAIGQSESAPKAWRTNDRHMSLGTDGSDDELLYQIPSQPSIDGNTVEEHQEMARFAKNAMNYEASLSFLNTRFKGLQTAIMGQ